MERKPERPEEGSPVGLRGPATGCLGPKEQARRTRRDSAGLPRWLPGTAAAVAFALLTLLYLRPVWQVGGDAIAPIPEDPLFNLYILKWGVHQIRRGLPDVWDANFYHPTPGVLALSDHLLGPAAQLTLLALLTPGKPNAIAGYNVLFVTSFVASALATAWVARRSGRSRAAALFAGWAFAFAPFRVQHLNHIQLLLAQWIPLTLWAWDRLLAERTGRSAVRFLAFYLLHVTGGCYLAYMIHGPLAAIFAVRARRAPGGYRALWAPAALRVLVPVALVAGLALAALFLPYVREARELGLARTPDEIGEYGATLASYLSPSTENLYFGVPPRGFFRSPLGPWAAPFYRTENALFAGFLPTGLAVAGAVAWLARRRRPWSARIWQRAVLAALLLLAALAWLWGDLLTLVGIADWPDLPAALTAGGWEAPGLLAAAALGLVFLLHRRWTQRSQDPDQDTDIWETGLAAGALLCFALSFPLAYLPLARVVPGLDGMRVPARFYAFVSLGIALFAARGLDGLLARLRDRRWRRALAAVLLVGLAVELAPKPVNWAPLLREEEFPDVYAWIAGRRDVRALVELPIRQNFRETAYMYFSTVHWKPIGNGYSGYQPVSHALLVQALGTIPGGTGLRLLRELGITHLVIHRDELDRRVRDPTLLPAFEHDFATGPGRQVEAVYRDEDATVYRVLGARDRPRYP